MISGSIVALVTPMDENNFLDWCALDSLIDFHIQEGTDAIVVIGSTGESVALTVKERKELIKRAVKRVSGRIPLIAGTGASSTQETIDLTLTAKELGADCCLLVTPCYSKPTQEGLYHHFKAIAEAVDIPQILYNIPSRTGCEILPSTVIRLSNIDRIIGIKEATGSLQGAKEIMSSVCYSNNFSVYSGDDGSAAELILLGGKGNISVTANIVPRTMKSLCSAALSGNLLEVRRLEEKIDCLNRILFIEPNPIPVKSALYEMRLIQQGIRSPLTWLNQKYASHLREAMREVGLLL